MKLKMKLKALAAAVALVAASGANAAITAGTGGNGSLFFNIWDANGSYTRDLNTTIDTFQLNAEAGNVASGSPAAWDFAFTADATFISFLNGTAGGVRTGTLLFNVAANDTSGANRLLTTFTEPTTSPTRTNDVIRSAGSATTTFINFANTALAGADLVAGTADDLDSVAVTSGSTAYAGKPAFQHNIGTLLNFSNAGTLANNSYGTGLSFQRIDALATGTANSVYNQYFDGNGAAPGNGGNEAHVFIDAANTLHIATVAAIPEPETYTLMLAGLGMIGFMARRRLNNRA